MKAEDRLKELIESGEINSLDAAKQEGFIKGWSEALRIHDVSGAVALLKFLKEEQQEHYKKADGQWDASVHQYYEEGIIAVLELIDRRFGN